MFHSFSRSFKHCYSNNRDITSLSNYIGIEYLPRYLISKQQSQWSCNKGLCPPVGVLVPHFQILGFTIFCLDNKFWLDSTLKICSSAWFYRVITFASLGLLYESGGRLIFKPNTHRRRRRDETVELRRVGDVNTPVGSRDPVCNFLCWQVTT